jgi:hypothetical protein
LTANFRDGMACDDKAALHGAFTAYLPSARTHGASCGYLHGAEEACNFGKYSFINKDMGWVGH